MSQQEFLSSEFSETQENYCFVVKTRAIKEKKSSKISFSCHAMSEKQSKCENISFLLVDIQIWIDFYRMAWWGKDNNEHNVLLWTFNPELILTTMSLTAPTISYK